MATINHQPRPLQVRVDLEQENAALKTELSMLRSAQLKAASEAQASASHSSEGGKTAKAAMSAALKKMKVKLEADHAAEVEQLKLEIENLKEEKLKEKPEPTSKLLLKTRAHAREAEERLKAQLLYRLSSHDNIGYVDGSRTLEVQMYPIQNIFSLRASLGHRRYGLYKKVPQDVLWHKHG